MLDDGTTLLSSDSSMAPKERKNLRSTFKIEIKIHCYSLKNKDEKMFKNRSKNPAFVLRILNIMLNSEVDRLYLQQLEYEMDRTNLPVDFFLK